MELWIRSQDKLILVPIKEALKACIGDLVEVSSNPYITQRKYDIFYKDIFLGTYKTKERALEVFDEIQELDIIDNPNIEKICYCYSLIRIIYNMPKE